MCSLDDNHSCIVMVINLYFFVYAHFQELCDTDLDYHIRKNAKCRKLTRANLRFISIIFLIIKFFEAFDRQSRSRIQGS